MTIEKVMIQIGGHKSKSRGGVWGGGGWQLDGQENGKKSEK